jgi:anaerobic selenocysteine-containing dehydrogenase
MQFDDPELYETDQSIIARLLEQANAGITFEQLSKAGTIHVPSHAAVQFEDLKFPTPSGRIRIAGECFIEAGLPAAPIPIAESRPAKGELRLLSPASGWLMNSSFGNEPKVLRQLGSRDVFLNQADAASLGLHDGDRLELSNPTGTLQATLGISPDVPPGVALTHKSRWLKSDQPLGNVNVLNPGKKSDLAESCAVHSIDIAIKRS